MGIVVRRSIEIALIKQIVHQQLVKMATELMIY